MGKGERGRRRDGEGAEGRTPATYHGRETQDLGRRVQQRAQGTGAQAGNLVAFVELVHGTGTLLEPTGDEVRSGSDRKRHLSSPPNPVQSALAKMAGAAKSGSTSHNFGALLRLNFRRRSRTFFATTSGLRLPILTASACRFFLPYPHFPLVASNAARSITTRT